MVIGILLVLLKISAALHIRTRKNPGERDRGTLVALQYVLYAQTNDREFFLQENRRVELKMFVLSLKHIP